MRPALYLSVAAISFIGACAAATPAESTNNAEVLAVNKLAVNRMIASRVFANRVAAKPIIAGQLSPSAMAVNMSTAGPLLANEDGRQVFSVIVSCALPADVVLTATVAGVQSEFQGELGLAPQWLRGPLDRVGQGWVSACMFARINGRDVAVPISMRGPTRALETGDDEREEWSQEEGAFFGNFFGAQDQPIQWFACRGRDQAAGDTGNLSNRICTEPDPAKPGFTRCGLIFAGDCGDFAADRSCEFFSARGAFYQGCHASPIQASCGGERGGAPRALYAYQQVITTFVTP